MAWKQSVNWGQTVDPSVRHETNLVKALPKSRPSDRKAAAARKELAAQNQAQLDHTTGLLAERRFTPVSGFTQLEENRPFAPVLLDARGLVAPPIERFGAQIDTQAGTTSFSPSSVVTAGSFAILMTSLGGGKSVVSVADSVGNPWTVDVSNNKNTIAVSICSVKTVAAITPSDIVTITWASSTPGSSPRITLQELDGMIGTLDQVATAGASVASKNQIVGPTPGLGSTARIAVAAFTYQSGRIGTPSGEWINANSSSLVGTMFEYMVVSSAAGVVATTTTSSSSLYSAAVAVYA